VPRTEYQKKKVLLLRRFLLQKTDEEHPVSISVLQKMLSDNDAPSERKSIYNDIQALQDDGLDIIYKNNSGYYIASRDFELAELKLLVDAIQASRFVTEKKSRELIRKLQSLCSEHEARLLNRNLAISGRGKTGNERIYYNVDALQTAIAENHSIIFRYFDWSPDGTKKFRPDYYQAVPIALCWDDEYYYLIAETEKHGITHYRVDKMEEISTQNDHPSLSEEARNLDLGKYTNRVFGMFSGEVETVRLRMRNELAGVVRDRFGADIIMIPDGQDHFIFSAEIAVSPLFFSWVLMFGDRAEILSPESVRRDYLALLVKSRSVYESDCSSE
jgi:predicted DNA-binding transcriptional regulator YafY